MNELDNPAWHALAGPQREFGVVGERAACYRADVSPFAAVADQSPEALEELAELTEPGRFVPLFAPGEVAGRLSKLWHLRAVVPLSQWVCPEPVARPASTGWVELGDGEAEQMVRLAKATDPGPFERQTHRLGDYVGIVADGKLVAMAGERMCLARYREVSAVCTHSDYQGRGYAQALVVEIARRQQQAGCTPFLHVRTGSPAEEQAKRVYENIGFVRRVDAELSVLLRL